MGTAAGCGRRLGSPEEELSFARQLAKDVEEHESCGTKPSTDMQLLEIAKSVSHWKASGRKLSAVKSYTIPVYFWHTYSPGSTPDQILTKEFIAANQFAALQYGFRDTPFQFELKDIQIVESAEFGHCEREAPSEYAMKAALKAPGKDVLNVYICDSSASDSRYWSSFPVEEDTWKEYSGVVLRNYATTPPGNKQINAIENIVHEVGHFLGLEHTFLGGCSNRVIQSSDGKIVVSGDGVDDTAQHEIPTKDVVPGEDVCWIFDPPLNTCKNQKYGADPVKNQMNYLLGTCSKKFGEFTPGQIERMVVQHETFRLDNICRVSDITCVSDDQCCAGLRCIGGSPMKKKCKGPTPK
ncbi:hypothetical protein MPSEU_000016800 [Mayamaea pseudoterrestris]|nr:hypothetical protein MPSEU_000016800 [Mayamaea pseudoterrestris]